jgi:hypothetical protein
MPTTLSLTPEAANPTPLFAAVQQTTWYSDESTTIDAAEYRAVEQNRVVVPTRVRDDDPEFTAILKMKTDALVLTPAEAAAYNGQGRRRARRVGKPLPLE